MPPKCRALWSRLEEDFVALEFETALERLRSETDEECLILPRTRLYRALAEGGMISLREGDIPLGDRERLVREIVRALQEEPSLEPPPPFDVPGTPEGNLFPLAKERRGGG